MLNDPSIVVAAAAVGIFGGVLFSRAAGAAETTEINSARAENFMMLYFSINCGGVLIINRLGLLDEYQLEESITRKRSWRVAFIEYGFLGQDLRENMR